MALKTSTWVTAAVISHLQQAAVADLAASAEGTTGAQAAALIMRPAMELLLTKEEPLSLFQVWAGDHTAEVFREQWVAGTWKIVTAIWIAVARMLVEELNRLMDVIPIVLNQVSITTEKVTTELPVVAPIILTGAGLMVIFTMKKGHAGELQETLRDPEQVEGITSLI